MKNIQLEKSINYEGSALEAPSILEMNSINEEFKQEIRNQFPPNFSVSIKHNCTMKMGYREYSEEKCPCCETILPRQSFHIGWTYKKRKMFEYGLDCGLYFFISKFYFFFLYSFLVMCLIYLIIYSTINKENFVRKILQIYRNIDGNSNKNPSMPSLRNFDVKLMDQFTDYNFFTSILNLIKMIFSINTKLAFWQLINIGLIGVVYLFINNKFDSFLRKIMVKYASDFVDPSNYSILVKNLPLYTNKDELMQFIIERYKTKEIIEIFMIPSFFDIDKKYKKLKLLADLGKNAIINGKQFDEKKFSNCKNNLLQHIKFNKFSCTAIILFDDPDDAKMFLRSEFDKEKRYVSYYKKPDYFRGNLIYFSSLPAIGNINWINVEYYRTKGFLKIAVLVNVFAVFTFLAFFIYGLIIEINTLITPSLLLFFIGEIIGEVTKILIKVVRFDDLYFEKFLSRYISTQKSTVMILFMSSSFSKFTFDNISDSNLIFIMNFMTYFALFIIKSFFTAKFNYDCIVRKIKLLWSLIRRKKLIQYEFNEIYQDNDFDIMENFENFRVMIYIAIISSLYSYAFLLFMTILIFAFYFFSHYGLFTSNYSQRSHFQNYFFYIYYLDFVNLAMIYLIKWSFTILIDMNPYITIFIYFFLDTCKDLFISFTLKDEFFYNKRYKEVNQLIKKKLENEKYINMDLLEEDVMKINLEVLFKDN